MRSSLFARRVTAAQQQHQTATAQRRFQASAAASPAVPTLDHLPKELRYYVDFDRTDQDLHFELLEEANLKHGVFLNVPPQLPPEGTPPTVPEVIMGALTAARLESLAALAYPPTHAPPPFETCGTRGIDNILIQQQGGGKATATASSSSLTPEDAKVPKAAEPEEAPQRRPIDPEAKFHCTLCHKSFKGRIAADHHASYAHDGALLGASIAAGPGEGEFVTMPTAAKQAPAAVPSGRSGRLTPAAAAPATSTPAPAAGGLEAVKKKVEYTTAELALPEEADIEAMLKGVWDDMGVKLKVKDFKESTAIVAGIADKRPPPGSEHLKPSFSATPMGVAPGIKKVVASKGAQPLNDQGRIMTNKEMAARFPNPFGDADLFADFEEDDNLNPFLPVATPSPKSAAAAASSTSDGSAASKKGADIDGGVKLMGASRAGAKPTTAAVRPANSIDLTHCGNSAILAKKLTCHLCQSTFRLLDSLHSHYEDEHDMAMPDEVLRASLAVSTTAPLYADKIPPARAEAMKAAEGGAAAGGDESGGAAGEGEGGYLVGSGGGSDGGASAVAAPVPIESADIAIHLRAQSNTVLLGTIVEVKRGFVKTHAVLQLIVKICHETSSDEKQAKEKEGADASSSSASETELITVRCYGDGFNAGLYQSEVRVGSQVMVNGTLRLNRRLDKISNRVHAYPYVLVMMPQGSIQLIE